MLSSINQENKTQPLPTELLCLRLFRPSVCSHTCVNLSYFTESSTSLNSKKQFRGIPRCHTKTTLWLAGKKHDSVFGITYSHEWGMGRWPNHEERRKKWGLDQTDDTFTSLKWMGHMGTVAKIELVLVKWLRNCKICLNMIILNTYL